MEESKKDERQPRVEFLELSHRARLVVKEIERLYGRNQKFQVFGEDRSESDLPDWYDDEIEYDFEGHPMDYPHLVDEAEIPEFGEEGDERRMDIIKGYDEAYRGGFVKVYRAGVSELTEKWWDE
jgi:hypothetical protein